jgi:glycosyltransferase involved in cell wall biosynthesis
VITVGWLADEVGYVGGAEMTAVEFRHHAPAGVTIVDCPPGHVARCDRYVVQNCVTYPLNDIRAVTTRRTIKYWNDVGSWLDPAVRHCLERPTVEAIYCSRLQAEYMGHADGLLIPPPVNFQLYERAAASMNGNRAGVVCVGSWRNMGKGAQNVARWAEQHGPVDFYGGGPFAPEESRQIAYLGMPALLARYQTFVFLPSVIEPFGRSVAEAWAAGCEIVTNQLVGAVEWLNDDGADAIRNAADDFWGIVLQP